MRRMIHSMPKSLCVRPMAAPLSTRLGTTVQPPPPPPPLPIPHHAKRIASHQPYLKPSRICNVVGMPMFQGQPLGGVERGPDAIRHNGVLVDRISQEGWRVHDGGNLACVSAKEYPSTLKTARNHNLIGSSLQGLYEHTRAATEAGEFCLTLGGDHSIAIGSIAGVLAARPDTGVIWLDAHADINTPDVSLSGNIHGMAVAFLMRLFDVATVPGFEWLTEQCRLLPERLVYIGLRDVDDAEKDIIRALNIKAFTMQDVDRMGIGETMNRAISHLVERRNLGLHVSLDIDSIDPAFAAATGTTVRGGLTYREAFYAVESIAETGLFTSMDVVEVNPNLTDPQVAEQTVDVAFRLILAALGDRIL